MTEPAGDYVGDGNQPLRWSADCKQVSGLGRPIDGVRVDWAASSSRTA